MARLGITAAFAQYGASLRNPQWSVSAWAPDGSLVVSLWDHHYQKGGPETMEFTGSTKRWSGPGNKEFRENVAKAVATGAKVRLVIVKTDEIARVEEGENGGNIKKDFFVRKDLSGQVVELNDDRYVFRFTKT
jgi:hypothetical protein